MEPSPSSLVEEEGTVTLGEVLALQNHLEESAVAVLGSADDKNCTYSEGYMKRQALYACLTCTPDVCDPAGFCLACNYHCHEGHSIVELYTKRNFRCDCGNSKFGDKKCNLEPNKDSLNVENVYNQNFKGKYCTCSRPYPDEENPVSDEMIQCALCEDWYHAGHLGDATVPESDEYCEMTCVGCINKHPMLQLYPHLLVKTEEVKQISPEPKPTDTQDGSKSNDITPKLLDDAKTNETIANLEVDKESTDEITGQNDAVRNEETPKTNGTLNGEDKNKKNDSEAEVDIETVKLTECLIKDKDITSNHSVAGAFFWDEGWRSQLCKCDKCLTYYNEHKIAFITDLTDMVEVYEKNSLESSQPPDPDADLQFLSTLDRVQQVEIISEYNDMKGKLVEYLKQFGEEKKVVKPEDIHKFFSNLNDCKRRRLNEDLGPPGLGF